MAADSPAQAITFFLADPANRKKKPEWTHTLFLGRDMTPFGELAVQALTEDGYVVLKREDLAHALRHAEDPDALYPPDISDCERCTTVYAGLAKP